MSKRLDIEKQQELEPKRIEFAKTELEKLGKKVFINGKTISFEHKNCIIVLYPYSGWFTGKSIIDGRGINNLLKQLQ